MKILIINYEYPPLGGGGGVATKQMAEELSKRHEVHVLTSTHESGGQEEELNGVRIHRVAVSGRKELPTATLQSMVMFVPKALARGWKLCQAEKFDVINAQFVLPSGLPARILATRFSIPLVVSFIGGDLYDPTKGISPHRHWYLRMLVRWVSKGARICTAISEDTKKRAQELHGIRKKIVVTHLGYVPARVPEKPRAKLGLPEDRPVVISVGRLIPRKGYGALLEAMRIFNDQFPIFKLYLLVLGDGPLRDQLKEEARELGVSEDVDFRGFVSEEEKLQLLKASDAYVSAAEHEGFGIVFLEAMDAGLPIVATDNGGHTDFLAPGRHALLVPGGDIRQLAEAMRRLLGDAGLMREMGIRNRTLAQRFTVEQTVGRFEEVLAKASQL